MGTGRSWLVQVQVSPSRRGVEWRARGSLTAWRRSAAWGSARGSLDVSAAGAALPPLFIPGGSCRVTRSAPPPASPKGRCDRNRSRSWGSGEDHPQSQTISRPTLHHRVTPHCSAPYSHKSESRHPHPEAGGEVLLSFPGLGLEWTTPKPKQDQSRTPPEKLNSQDCFAPCYCSFPTLVQGPPFLFCWGKRGRGAAIQG